MKSKFTITSLATALLVAGAANADTFQGPSTGSTPYAIPVQTGIDTISIATVDNTGATADDTFTRIGTSPVYGTAAYGMVGIPDGLGAFDNGDNTFTVVMNQELGNTVGATRDHGSKGSFVSLWVINKNTLAVTGAKDLMQTVKLWNGSGYTTYNNSSPMPNSGTPYFGAFGRFCSADLPAVSAFSNSSLGTTERIFMNGEEIGDEGRAMAHIITGSEAGTSYELPRLGKFSWENSVACPHQQNKTIVMGLDDTTPGQVYVYIGDKTSSGSEVDKAGLTNGLLYGIKVGSTATELRASAVGNIVKGGATAFSLQILNTTGDVSGRTGAQNQANSVALGITEFLRPEDGAWDTINPNWFYFVTTDRYDQTKDNVGAQSARSRLYRLEFSDITNPTAGGVIRLMIDGSETLANSGLNMMDNIGVDADGNVTIVEDVGGQAHNGKIARFSPASGKITILAQHDRARFGDVGANVTSPFSNDEEFSGNIDITSIMAGSTLNTGRAGERWYLFADQAHYTTNVTTAQAEGGQLIAMHLTQLQTSATGFARDRRTGTYSQILTVTNNTNSTVSGQQLKLTNLTSGVTLQNATGTTAGVPYVSLPSLTAGASTSLTLQFTNPSNGAINYAPVVE